MHHVSLPNDLTNYKVDDQSLQTIEQETLKPETIDFLEFKDKDKLKLPKQDPFQRRNGM